MKFKEYLENLNKLAESRPETLEMKVCTSSDDEGNRYNSINFPPSIGEFRDNKEFVDENSFEEYMEECGDEYTANCVCVN